MSTPDFAPILWGNTARYTKIYNIRDVARLTEELYTMPEMEPALSRGENIMRRVLLMNEVVKRR